MIRPRYWLVLALAIQLAACGERERDPAEDAARNFVAQSALFCPNEGFSWEAFDNMAGRLGAAPDDGDVRRPPTVRKAEIMRERWVALNHLGHRTTVWIAELGPGHQFLPGSPEGIAHASGLACAVHDPQTSRADAFALARAWEGGHITGMVKAPDDPSRWTVLAKTWVNSVRGAPYYQDVELRVDDPEASDGAMIVRRRFDYRR